MSDLNLKNDETTNKLILLFVFDKMEVPMSESTVLDICCSSNPWIPYMDCKPMLPKLIEASFIHETKCSHGEALYTITTEGRICLAHFFIRIPSSLREEISEFIKENRMKYRRKQAYDSDYVKNSDGTYTLILKIIDSAGPVFKLEFSVPNRNTAKHVYKNWEDKAPQVYSLIYDQLVED